MQLKFNLRNTSYTLRLTGKFNIIVGNSGTGKTYLKKFAEKAYQMDKNNSKGVPHQLISALGMEYIIPKKSIN